MYISWQEGNIKEFLTGFGNWQRVLKYTIYLFHRYFIAKEINNACVYHHITWMQNLGQSKIPKE